ncbi:MULTISPECIES: lytic transglycosylase domain-containing protein [unclassified Paraburkholderia]|uniref:lytic transglycosylase domain-containing protein n=1 Tax=unclassified Paraburkholderia TaxID=2615204 RepID=UPI002AB735EB|nr:MULTISPECIES: lytic transglycosylase domain-containing protein [unclassified Paraburkholderia]
MSLLPSSPTRIPDPHPHLGRLTTLLRRGAGALTMILLSPVLAGVALLAYSEDYLSGEQERSRRVIFVGQVAGWKPPPDAQSLASATEVAVQSRRPGRLNAAVQVWASKLNFAATERRFGLPTGLLGALAQQESSGNAHAVSYAGARGLFQLMPTTAREYHVDPMNPSQSAWAAARKLSGLIRHYGGDLTSALRAYNWGEGNLDRKGLSLAPMQTLSYAPSVMSRMGDYSGGGISAQLAAYQPGA